MILVYVETSAAEGISEVSLETITFARDLSAAGNRVPIDAVGSGRLKLTLPPPTPSSAEVLGEGPETAKVVVDLLQKLGVTR